MTTTGQGPQLMTTTAQGQGTAPRQLGALLTAPQQQPRSSQILLLNLKQHWSQHLLLYQESTHVQCMYCTMQYTVSTKKLSFVTQRIIILGHPVIVRCSSGVDSPSADHSPVSQPISWPWRQSQLGLRCQLLRLCALHPNCSSLLWAAESPGTT